MIPSRLSSPRTPKIPDAERTPLVAALLEIIQRRRELAQARMDEIARLKGEKARPKIKRSKLEPASGNHQNRNGTRPGSARRRTTGEVEIHETKVLTADTGPPESRVKGDADFTVHGLGIKAPNVLYRRERWEPRAGDSLVAPLPPEGEARGGHFDSPVISFMLSQYYSAPVPQPLILEPLGEFGVDISAGPVNTGIPGGHARFHRERDAMLRVGREGSGYVNVDDTGARHHGKHGYGTHIGNERVAGFQSTESKRRSNVLGLLRAGPEDYVLTAGAFEYRHVNTLPTAPLARLGADGERCFADEAQWTAARAALTISQNRPRRLATEGARLGSALAHGLNPELGSVSDEAEQFNVRLHGRCWSHAERTIGTRVGCTDEQRAAVEERRTPIWDFDQARKAYREAPVAEKKAALETRFDEIFTRKTGMVTLTLALTRRHNNTAELRLGLERPDIPRHNNPSARDIREDVQQRKSSGSTRSELGRRCRDTFARLKRSCRKLGGSFGLFLNDRVRGTGAMAPLPDRIRRVALRPGE